MNLLVMEMMMRGKWKLAFFSLIAISLWQGPAAHGQAQQGAGQAQQAPAARRPYAYRETDIGGSIYSTFTSASTGNGVVQTPTNATGGMLEIRHIQRPLIGYEITYSYNAADETFAPTPAPGCGLVCANPVQSLQSKGSLVGLDWVFSKKYGPLRPFAVGGLGFFIDEPSGTHYPINDIVRITYTYGGGVDWAFTDHFGVRAQFRGNFYKAPNLSIMYPSVGKFTSMNEPMGGIFYAF